MVGPNDPAVRSIFKGTRGKGGNTFFPVKGNLIKRGFPFLRPRICCPHDLVFPMKNWFPYFTYVGWVEAPSRSLREDRTDVPPRSQEDGDCWVAGAHGF